MAHTQRVTSIERRPTGASRGTTDGAGVKGTDRRPDKTGPREVAKPGAGAVVQLDERTSELPPRVLVGQGRFAEPRAPAQTAAPAHAIATFRAKGEYKINPTDAVEAEIAAMLGRPIDPETRKFLDTTGVKYALTWTKKKGYFGEEEQKMRGVCRRALLAAIPRSLDPSIGPQALEGPLNMLKFSGAYAFSGSPELAAARSEVWSLYSDPDNHDTLAKLGAVWSRLGTFPASERFRGFVESVLLHAKNAGVPPAPLLMALAEQALKSTEGTDSFAANVELADLRVLTSSIPELSLVAAGENAAAREILGRISASASCVRLERGILVEDSKLAARLKELSESVAPALRNSYTVEALGKLTHRLINTERLLKSQKLGGVEQQAVGAVRDAISAAIQRADETSFPDEAQRASNLYELCVSLEELGHQSSSFTQWAQARSLLLKSLADPECHDAMQHLGRFVHFVRQYDSGETFNVLNLVANYLHGESRHVMDLECARVAESWAPIFHGESTGGSPMKTLRDKAKARFGGLLRDEGHSVAQAVTDAAVMCPSERAQSLLERLLKSTAFRESNDETKATLAACLPYMSEIAATTPSSSQRILLENTIERIMTGAFVISASELHGAAGTANYSKGIVTLNKGMRNDTYGISPSQGLRHLALSTLPHEVSHMLSGQPYEASVAYFEEEYRAWMTGFVGMEGRLPNQEEAAKTAVFLLTDTKLYPVIGEAYRRDPGSFSKHMEALGLPTDGRPLPRRAGDPEKTAPVWGWEGFLENRPKSAHS
jgi:hypothetical protein